MLTQPPKPRARAVMKRVARRRSRERVYEWSGIWEGMLRVRKGVESGSFGEMKERRARALDEVTRGCE